MQDDKFAAEQWSVVKQLFAIVQLQGQQIDALRHSHYRFIAAVASQFGIEPEPAPAVMDDEEMAKAQQGLEQLEAMFKAKDDDPDDEKGGP